MAFLTAIYAFIADITILNGSFTKIQLIGLILALVIYIAQLIYFLREAKIKKETEDDVIIKQEINSLLYIEEITNMVTDSIMSAKNDQLLHVKSQ